MDGPSCCSIFLLSDGLGQNSVHFIHEFWLVEGFVHVFGVFKSVVQETLIPGECIDWD